MDGKQQASGSHQDQCTERQQTDHSGSGKYSDVENVVGEPGEVTVSLTSQSSNQKYFRLSLSSLLPVQRRMMQVLLVFLFSSSCGDAAHVALGSTGQDHGDLGNVVQESALGKIEPPLQLVFPEGVDPPTGKQAH